MVLTTCWRSPRPRGRARERAVTSTVVAAGGSRGTVGGRAAGTEEAVAATKTYTATLLALYLLVDAMRNGTGEHVADIGELASRTLTDTVEDVERAVARYRFADRILTTARGYSYATALEGSLKLSETSYLPTRAYSGADLLHGPIAAVDTETAVVGVAGIGAGGASMLDVFATLSERGADLLCVGSAAFVPSAA